MQGEDAGDASEGVIVGQLHVVGVLEQEVRGQAVPSLVPEEASGRSLGNEDRAEEVAQL